MSGDPVNSMDPTCARRTECHLPPGLTCEGPGCPQYRYRRPAPSGVWARTPPVEIRPHEMDPHLVRYAGVSGRGDRGVTRRVALQSR